jgi:hypothetical protein
VSQVHALVQTRVQALPALREDLLERRSASKNLRASSCARGSSADRKVAQDVTGTSTDRENQGRGLFARRHFGERARRRPPLSIRLWTLQGLELGPLLLTVPSDRRKEAWHELRQVRNRTELAPAGEEG